MATRKSKASPYVISHGTDDYYLDQDRDRAKRGFANRDCVVLDGNDVADHEVVSVCETRSFDGNDRVVVLDNAEKVKDKGALSAYIKGKDPADLSVILVVIIRKMVIPEVWRSASTKSNTATHKKLKPYETDKLIRAIEHEAGQIKLKLGKSVPSALLRYLGDDLRVVVKELHKLTWLVGSDGVVTMDHLRLVLAIQQPAEPWQVGDAVIDKNVRRAMELVSLLYRYMGDGVSVPITHSLMKQVERAIIARRMIDQGDAPKVIAGRLGMSPNACEYHFLPKVKRHSFEHLRQQMKTLCRLDAAVKGSARSKRTQVELAILSVAA